ncbi:MAG: hypothetical protein RL154_19, partial [Pseudomonadota bacterium]
VLLTVAAFAVVAASLFALRKARKQTIIPISSEPKIDIKRFIEILEEVYKLRLVLER